MKKELVIYSKETASFRLRSINIGDIEEIRLWKNRNAKSFFYKAEITEEQQKEWFANYLTREEDYIFISEVNIAEKWVKYGCLGYRLIEDTIDLYNIIRGSKTDVVSSMKVAMKLLVEYLQEKYTLKIKCDVLIDNPAVTWYNKCGFFVREEKEDYYIMVFGNRKKES